MQWALIALLSKEPHCLAMDNDDLPIPTNRKRLRTSFETNLKILWGDQYEDTSEGVMGRNAVR
jgi:hypothetical protein